MNIPKEVLSEENYTGNRRIHVSHPMITKYKAEIDEIQKQANPSLKKMEGFAKKLDPSYAKIQELTNEINAIKAEMAPTLELYNIEVAKVEVKDQKAQMVKNKLQPIINKIIKGQLGEFERPIHVVTEKGQHYVEVSDIIEDFVKARRASNK
jgi:seryl-tRNA synthetase